MSKPTISEAKALAKKHDQPGIVILWFNEDTYGFSSYGANRSLCQKYGKVADQIANRIESGDIEL